MAPPDVSLRPNAHRTYTPVRIAPSATSQTAPAASAASTAVPSFTAVFASMAAAAAEAGTTVASTVPGPGATAAPAAAAASTTPTAASNGPAGPLFGANPWLTDPTGSGPGPVTNYNPVYFATPQTAQTVAQMVGGTVVSMDQITTAPGSPFQQDEPNLMVQLPNGGLINPGLVADIYTHGWNQAFVNQQVASEVAGAVPASTNA
jgi:hypothetical protein